MAKVFVSHSSRDKDIVKLFKEKILKLGIGLADNEIFFTSSVETGVPIGGNIPQCIKENLIDCEYVFLMISENYKKSEVCLNEMGAAMVHDKLLFPVVLYNYSFDRVGWLIDRTLCIRIDDEERLDEIRDIFYKNGMTACNTSIWNRYRNEFLGALESLVVEPKEQVVIKGMLDYQIELEENQNQYKRDIDYLNSLIPAYGDEARGLIISNNESTSLPERKKILVILAEVLNKWADGIAEVTHRIDSSLSNSLKAVDNIIKIKTVSLGEKERWIQEVKIFKSQCEENFKALKANRLVVASLEEMEQNQIQAKKRLQENYDSLLEVYDKSIKKINEIIEKGRRTNSINKSKVL